MMYLQMCTGDDYSAMNKTYFLNGCQGPKHCAIFVLDVIPDKKIETIIYSTSLIVNYIEAEVKQYSFSWQSCSSWNKS